MAVTAYDIVIATDAVSLKSEVLAATGQVPQGEPFVRGGFPGQALVTGTPVVGYASAAYNVIIGFDARHRCCPPVARLGYSIKASTGACHRRPQAVQRHCSGKRARVGNRRD